MTARPRNGGLRALAWFWAAVLILLGAGAATLQTLGPPDRHKPLVAEAPPKPEATHRPTISAAPAPPKPPAPPPGPPGGITPPDAAMLEPAPDITDGWLPRIGPNGQPPMRVYAAPFDRTDTRPRVGILVTGFGTNAAESSAALARLPGAVSVAFSPYPPDLAAGAAEARSHGHETLVSIPMEPVGYPLNDPGDHALLTGASDAVNAQRLEWALTRFTGYVGATGALGDMRGERFAAATDQMAPVLATLATHGLLYVDPRPNAPRPLATTAANTPRIATRAVDVVLDDPPGPANIDQRLALLEQMAKDRGAALALAGRPNPVVVDRITVWAAGLESRGLVLAPVSAIVQMPQAGTVSGRLPPP